MFANQQAYYNDAINQSSNAVNSGIFIDFMLQEIYKTLKVKQTKMTEMPPQDMLLSIQMTR